MVEVIEKGMADGVVALVAHGKVSHQDYRDLIGPAIERKLQTYPKVRLLYYLGRDFEGYSAEAMWDDAVLGMRHKWDFEKAAVVTDVDWIRNSVAFFRFLIPCPVRVFHNNELGAATEWINA